MTRSYCSLATYTADVFSSTFGLTIRYYWYTQRQHLALIAPADLSAQKQELGSYEMFCTNAVTRAMSHRLGD
eukprot:1902152-Rhodomonas_salina.1